MILNDAARREIDINEALDGEEILMKHSYMQLRTRVDYEKVD